MDDFKLIIEALIKGDEARLIELVKTALEQGVPAKKILQEGLIAGMDIVGEKMENEDMFQNPQAPINGRRFGSPGKSDYRHG